LLDVLGGGKVRELVDLGSGWHEVEVELNRPTHEQALDEIARPSSSQRPGSATPRRRPESLRSADCRLRAAGRELNFTQRPPIRPPLHLVDRFERRHSRSGKCAGGCTCGCGDERNPRVLGRGAERAAPEETKNAGRDRVVHPFADSRADVGITELPERPRRRGRGPGRSAYEPAGRSRKRGRNVSAPLESANRAIRLSGRNHPGTTPP
jgi:hypothetical protein